MANDNIYRAENRRFNAFGKKMLISYCFLELQINSFSLTVIRCPSLDTPYHAEKSGFGCSGQNSNYGISCFFRCKLGYETVGGSLKRTCLETRQWSGTELQCQGKEIWLKVDLELYIVFILNSPMCLKWGLYPFMLFSDMADPVLSLMLLALRRCFRFVKKAKEIVQGGGHSFLDTLYQRSIGASSLSLFWYILKLE